MDFLIFFYPINYFKTGKIRHTYIHPQYIHFTIRFIIQSFNQIINHHNPAYFRSKDSNNHPIHSCYLSELLNQFKVLANVVTFLIQFKIID